MRRRRPAIRRRSRPVGYCLPVAEAAVFRWGEQRASTAVLMAIGKGNPIPSGDEVAIIDDDILPRSQQLADVERSIESLMIERCLRVVTLAGLFNLLLRSRTVHFFHKLVKLDNHK